MSAASKEWISRWKPGDPTLTLREDDLVEEPTDPIIEYMDEADELLAINKKLLAENEQLKKAVEQQQPIIQDFEKRALKIIKNKEYKFFIKKVRTLIDLLSGIDTTQPFWSIPIDEVVVTLEHFYLVNQELLTLMNNYASFDSSVKKYVRFIQMVYSALVSRDLGDPQDASFLWHELSQILQAHEQVN